MKILNHRAARRLLVTVLLPAATSLSTPAAAVPIPWKNCGKPVDVLSMQQYDASVWPPQDVAAPVNAIATFDTAGELTNLRVFLVFGVAWTLDSGPLPTSTSGGFVSLPASFAVSVTSPPLPLAAGPYVTTHTFGGKHGPTPVTVTSKSTLAAQVDAPLLTNLSLGFNGTPGFPLTPPVAGNSYNVHVQMTESGGTEVFCLDLTMPIKGDALLVNVVPPPAIPLLSPTALAILALFLAACGVFMVRRAV